MATYDDLASGLNNSKGLSLANALAERNPTPSLTLAEQKSRKVSDKLFEKQQRLNPSTQSLAQSNDNFSFFDGADRTNILDLAEASVFRAGGNLVDMSRDVSNSIFGTEFDSSEESGFSNSQNADVAAEVSSQYRNQFVQDQDQVLQDVAGGNWLDAIGSTANVAVRTAADSFATVPELAAGAALTSVGGAGLAVIGRRLQKAKETAEKVVKRYDKIKEGNLTGLVKKGLKESSKASVLTADIVQQQRNQYKAENNGEEMSSERLAGSVLLTLATTIWQPSIATRFYKPKLKTTKADGEFKDRLKKEAQSLLDTSNRGVMQNLALRVGEGIKGIAAAGGAEAVQEYAQFWAETLSVQMKPDEQKGFLEAALDVFTKEGNADQAIQSAFLGAGAGAVTKGATSTPTNAVGAVVDTVSSVTNSAIRKSSQKINEAAPDSDVLSMTAQDRSRARSALRVKKSNQTSIDTLSSSSSLADIDTKNTEILNRLTKVADGRNLNDQEVFDAVKKTAMKNLNAEIVASEISTTGKRVVGITSRGAAALKKRTEELVTEVVTPQRMRKVKVFTEKTKRKITEEVKDFPNSTTMGLIELSGEYAANKTKENLAKLREKAQAIGPKFTRKIAESIKEDAPQVAAALNEAALKQENAAKESGMRNDNLTTSENLSPVIESARSISVFNEDDIDIAMSAVYDASFGEFDSEATVKKVQEAAAKIQSSSVFQELPVEDQTAFKTVADNLKEKIGPASRSTVETVKAKATEAVEKVTSTFDFIPPSKNPKEVDSVRSKSLRAINAAFNKLVSMTSDNTKDGANADPLLIEYDGSSNTFNDDGTLIPVYQNPGDPKSKVIASITKSPFVEQVRENMRTARLSDDENVTNGSFDLVVDQITSPNVVAALSQTLNTKDPRVVQAVLTFFEPKLSEPKYSENLKSKIETVLKPKPKTKTAESRQKFRTDFDSKTTNTDNAPQVDEDTKIQKDTFVTTTEDGISYIVAETEFNESELAFLTENIKGCE